MKNRISRTPTTLWIAALMLGILAVLPAADCQAQAGEQLRAELERTNDLLERVFELAQEAGQPKAVELLMRAKEVQELAWQRFEQMMTGGQPTARQIRQIATLTSNARDLARRAEQLLREQNTLAERARRAIEACSRLAEQMSEHAGLATDQQTRRFQEAVRLCELAHRHFQDHEFEIAIRLAESSYRLLSNLRDSAGSLVGREQLAQNLQRTRVLLERVMERVSELPAPAQARVEEAARLQSQAEEAFKNGMNLVAARLTRQARTILRNILQRVGGNVSEEAVRRAAERFDAELADLREQAGSDLPVEIEQIVRRAVDARERAEELAASGDLKGALARLRVALGLLSRAREKLGAGQP